MKTTEERLTTLEAEVSVIQKEFTKSIARKKAATVNQKVRLNRVADEIRKIKKGSK